MKCERSVITITLHRLGYLVHSLDNRAMTLPTETSKIVLSILNLSKMLTGYDNDLHGRRVNGDGWVVP